MVEFWHWADLVQVVANVGRASQGWLGLSFARDDDFALAKLCPSAPGIWKAFLLIAVTKNM